METSKNIKDNKVQTVRVPFFWIRDSAGHKSVSVTLLVISFFVTTIAFVLSIFEKIGPLSVRPFDVSACGVYMVPILSLYFGRKWSDGANGITQARDAVAIPGANQHSQEDSPKNQMPGMLND